MRLCIDRSKAVFDVPSSDADLFVSTFENHGTIQVIPATSLPPLVQMNTNLIRSNSSGNYNRGSRSVRENGGSFNGNNYRSSSR